MCVRKRELRGAESIRAQRKDKRRLHLYVDSLETKDGIKHQIRVLRCIYILLFT